MSNAEILAFSADSPLDDLYGYDMGDGSLLVVDSIIEGTGAIDATVPTLAGAGDVGGVPVSGTGAIDATVPTLAGAGEVGGVPVSGTGAILATVPTLSGTGTTTIAGPTVSSIVPSSGKFGDFVIITGTKLGTSGMVAIGEIPLHVIEHTETLIRAQLTFGVPSGLQDVIVYSTASNSTGILSNGFTGTPDTGETVRSKIRKAIKYQLSTITKANGFYNDIRKVYDPPKVFNNIKVFPAVNLYWLGEERNDEHYHGNNSLLDLELTCNMVVYLNEREDPNTAADTLLADIQRKFGTQYYILNEAGERTVFNCIYQSMEPFGIDTNSPDYGISLDLKIFYRIRLTDPNTMN
jgi:hypothetical protein